MNDKKTISMIFKTLNYTNEIKKKSTNGHGGRRQLFKSLRHSLRIPASQPKKLEWFDEQSHMNLIWLPDTGVLKLDDYPKEQREELLVRISDEAEAPTIVNDNRSELLELKSKLKNKVKNASKKETDEGSILAFQNILNAKGVVDTEQLLSDLDQFDIKRKSQKVETARQFLKCHNDIEHGPKALVRKNQAVIQEAFFKFPSKNEVTGVSPEGRIELIRDFYEQVFPEYPIHFVVLHGDEDVDLKDHSDHPHIFISTKNSKTGRYDLRESQIRKVNSYLKNHRPGTDLISQTPDYLESQLLFGYLQDMFYAYTNNRLLKNTPYHAKKHENTEGHMNKLRFINGDSKKPKSERAFNLYTLAQEKKEKAVQEAKQAKEYTHQAKRYVATQLTKAEQAKQEADDAIERQRLAEQATAEEYEQATAYRRSSSHYKQSIEDGSAEHARIQAEIASQRAELKLFKTHLSNLVDGIVNWIDELFSSRRKDIEDKCLERAREAFNRVRENDNTKELLFTKKAEEEVNQQLGILAKYKELFPDLPEVEDIRRSITKIKP